MMKIARMLATVALGALALSGCSLLQSSAPTAAVGECLDISELGSTVEELKTFSCDEPHEAEVYAVFDLELAGDYAETAVIEQTENQCISRFEEFVGISDYWESELDVYYLYPLAEGWKQGDKQVICAVVTPNYETLTFDKTTGSYKGVNK